MLPCKPKSLEVLTKAKLDQKRICFGNKKVDHVNLKKVFQLFRVLSGGGGVRELTKIPVGQCGYLIPWLKFDCNISSCCVYVVPCQMKLSVEAEIKSVTVMIV